MASDALHPDLSPGTDRTDHRFLMQSPPNADGLGAPVPPLDLLARIRQVAIENPSRIAIESAQHRVSYAELDDRADWIATTLRERFEEPGTIVAVLISDRALLIPVLLGVLRARGVFAPLDPDLPQDRTSRLARCLQPNAILTSDRDRSLAERLAGELETSCAVIDVPTAATWLTREAQASPEREPVAQSPQAPGYVYFTSGSTGHPKGVVGRTSSLAARIQWEIEQFRIPAGFRCSQLVAPTFDAWFRDVLMPLCVGGTVCVPPELTSRTNPERLLEWIRDARIQVMHCGPTLLTTLVSAPPRIRRLPELRIILLSGEFLHVSLVARWQRRFGKRTTLVNLYGATEATMIQFFHVIKQEDLRHGFIPIGRPLPGEHVLLVNADGQPCRAGRVGEIYLAGPAMSLGYLRNEPATRDAFVETEFPDGHKRLAYRTGDLAVEHPDGNYQLLGRHDHQLKIRGVRVEPREVEDRLTGYPLVAACAVKGVERPERELELVAYIVPETRYRPAPAEMRARLRETLPPQMIPTHFVFLENLPLTDTGKIDREALPAPDWLQSDRSGEIVEPRNPLEETLVDYWSEILGVPVMGIHDSFLDLGGHSLSVMRFLNRLDAEMGLRLGVREVFESATVARLAERIQARKWAPSSPPMTPDSLPGSIPGLGIDEAAGEDREERTQFGCPETPSPWFGKRRCNLVLMLSQYGDRESFERLARHVEDFDQSITTALVEDEPHVAIDLPARPTLIVSAASIRHLPEIPGRVFCGSPLSKSEESERLEAAGIPVPPWVRIEEGQSPDLEGLGEYVVRKPDYGAKGAEVRIVRRDRVRWRRVETSTGGPSPALIIQEFVYTGPWPVSYRVNTLFGRALFAIRLTGRTDRPPLHERFGFGSLESGTSVSIVANARDSRVDFCDNAEIIRLGERAHSAFPEIPLLGVDILQDADTGRLFVIEVNALGYNWNLTHSFREEFRLDIDAQFDGVRKAAYVLAEQTQRLASGSRQESTRKSPPS